MAFVTENPAQILELIHYATRWCKEMESQLLASAATLRSLQQDLIACGERVERVTPEEAEALDADIKELTARYCRMMSEIVENLAAVK